MNYIFDKIASEAGALTKLSGKKTLGTKDIQTAVSIVLSRGELSACALTEGDRALRKYQKSLREIRVSTSHD